MTDRSEIKNDAWRIGQVPAEIIPSMAGEISALASANAPFIHFDTTPYAGYLNGTGSITLVTHRQIGISEDACVSDRVIVAHLKGNIEAIKALHRATGNILEMVDIQNRNAVAAAAEQAEAHQGGFENRMPDRLKN